MDSLLIAATQDPSLLTTILTVTKAVVLVLIGVNLLIIVHEWGHFIVARMCGVKCEKFYIWFDIFGWKLFKFKWGDTEFGLGVLPLGGYVKMLGQEDNPGRLREELEKAKALEAAKQGGTDDDAESGKEEAGAEHIDIKAAEAALYDPESYLSKSVPQRMAIISAGVIMNVAFALVVAVLAYGIGVYKLDSEIGGIAPGGAAWRADLRVGDRVIEVADQPVSDFIKLREATMLGNIKNGMSIVVDRPGADKPVRAVVEPDRDQPVPTIGIGSPDTTTLHDESPAKFDLPAYHASAAFEPGDRVLAVNGQPVENGHDYHRFEALLRDKPMQVLVQRKDIDGTETKELTITVPTRPMRRLGLTMTAGAIDAVQPNSPAAKAGLKRGDKIIEVNGEPLGDPLTLADRLRKLVTQAIETGAKPEAIALTLENRSEPVLAEPRSVDWYELPMYGTEHVSIPTLGITIEVSPQVASVQEGSPADGVIKPGDIIKTFKPIPPDNATQKQLGYPDDISIPDEEIDLAEDDATWYAIFYFLQKLPPGMSVELGLQDRTVTLDWVEDDQWHHPVRGLQFKPKETFIQAQSLGEAFTYGLEETQNALAMVYKFLGKIGTQVSATSIGGPITIVKVAYRAASSRFSDLLLFLCLISANLAVINFLPIPVLDGGHMVFLAYEGVRGKPPSENVQIGLSYVGLFFLLGLMVWVFGLDLGFISR